MKKKTKETVAYWLGVGAIVFTVVMIIIQVIK